MQPPDNKDSVLARFKEGPALLEHTLAGLKETHLDRSPSKGGWTIRQIVHHLVDGDDIWKYCIKIALGNEQAEFNLDWYRTLSQVEWGERWAYKHRSIDVSLTLLKTIREHITQILEKIPDGWNRSIGFREPNGEIKRVSVGTIIEMQADHVMHHLKLIKDLVDKK